MRKWFESNPLISNGIVTIIAYLYIYIYIRLLGGETQLDIVFAQCLYNVHGPYTIFFVGGKSVSYDIALYVRYSDRIMCTYCKRAKSGARQHIRYGIRVVEKASVHALAAKVF